MPPVNCCEDLTDEEDGKEEEISIDNLPASHLLSEAELVTKNNFSDSDSCSDAPLSAIANQSTSSRKKKVKKIVHWKKEDINSKFESWPVLTSVDNLQAPVDLFLSFVDDPLIAKFVAERNNYAKKNLVFEDVSANKIKTFIGILLLSGYVDLPRRRMFWERDADTHNDLVAKSVSRNRFEFITSNIHCCDNLTIDKNDKYAKVRPMFEKLDQKFLEFTPHNENFIIDEAMIAYYGKHTCKQFMKSKPVRWEGTTHNGYVSWMEPYQGATTIIDPKYKHLGLGASVVLSFAPFFIDSACKCATHFHQVSI